MKIAGVVAEYNPFHNGHKYQIEQMRKNGVTHVVAVMSGNFVQRGDFAITSKWERAQSAVMNGVDLVIELPSPYALSSAQGFAQSATYILTALGCVDEIYFGCECGDVEIIKKIAESMLSKEYPRRLTASLDEGISYPAACEKAVREILADKYNDELKFPNNLLATEYVKALMEYDSKITPCAIKRVGSMHDSADANGQFASASAIRQTLINQGVDGIRDYVPISTFKLLSRSQSLGKSPCDLTRLERAFLSKLRALSPADFKDIPDVSEGLENRIADAVKTSLTLEELYEKVKTKRYTHSRIRRIILRTFLGITSRYSASPPPYARILACNVKGRQIIKKAKKITTIPIITKPAHILRMSNPFAKRLFEKENELTDIFSLSSPVPQPCALELTENLYVE
ncbi:MAG: nucleotidyltransferase [Clostridia bacterium]|nr:nucleotidyltransferase [Clostridia bacterium]